MGAARGKQPCGRSQWVRFDAQLLSLALDRPANRTVYILFGTFQDSNFRVFLFVIVSPKKHDIHIIETKTVVIDNA